MNDTGIVLPHISDLRWRHGSQSDQYTHRGSLVQIPKMSYILLMI